MDAVCIDNDGNINPINIPINIANTILTAVENGNKYTISVTRGAKHVPNNPVYTYLRTLTPCILA